MPSLTSAAGLGPLLNWFTGGDRPYMRLAGCMRGDWLWIGITIALDLAVAAGYAVIAMHWWKNERHLPPIPAKRALRNMRNIFAFCGICGYLFLPVKMFWPAWRLYDMVMVVLVYFTWKYAWGARDLKVIYAEIGRSRKLEDELNESREESKRKSYFLNAISHDLRTPLNGLLLQANLAEIGMATSDLETAHAAVAEIKHSAKVTAELLNGFLEYARLDWAGETNVITEMDVAGLLREVINHCTVAAEQKGIYLRGNVPPRLVIGTDRAKLHRILLNLITNAVKFTEQGGVRVEVERTGSSLEIHVIDSGVGIDPAGMEQLFGEFVQLHNGERDRRKGFGLGLTIARRLARQMGGDVVVESAAGQGSRFSVVVPVEGVQQRAELPTGAPTTQAPMTVGA